MPSGGGRAEPLGRSVADLLLQAEALGLRARQFRAFDRDGIETELEVPDHWAVLSQTAVGVPAPGAEPVHPARRTVDEVLWRPLDLSPRR